MVITDLLPGAPLMFLLAILAAHPVYISVSEQFFTGNVEGLGLQNPYFNSCQKDNV